MHILANADEAFLKELLDSRYVSGGNKTDIKVELARRSKSQTERLILTYREVYDMSDWAINEVLVGDVLVSDGTLEEVGNEWDRRVTDGVYTLNANPYGWEPSR